MKYDSATYKLTDKGKVGTISLWLGIAGLLAAGFGYITDGKEQFYFSWLVAFFFWLSVGLGSLFFVLLHHLTRASWSTALRRMAESMMSTIPFMLILFIPVIVGMHELYEWTHKDVVATDHILHLKEPYLNIPFFLIRVVLFFGVWSVLTYFLNKHSFKQDERHDDSMYTKWRKISAPGMLLFAFTLTYASIDWLMSLEPHWFSTIFGVYIFSGVFIAALGFSIIVVSFQDKQGVLKDVITVEHRHNLGKLLFAFTVFWAYIGFSQYLLIWYANLPEEAFWFLNRWKGSWKAMSLILPICHFGIPFVALIPRAAKRSYGWLLFMAFYMMVMHYIDLYWIIMPTLHKNSIHYSMTDISSFIGIGGIFFWLFWRTYTKGALVPAKDPGLKLSIEHVN